MMKADLSPFNYVQYTRTPAPVRVRSWLRLFTKIAFSMRDVTRHGRDCMPPRNQTKRNYKKKLRETRARASVASL